MFLIFPKYLYIFFLCLSNKYINNEHSRNIFLINIYKKKYLKFKKNKINYIETILEFAQDIFLFQEKFNRFI